MKAIQVLKRRTAAGWNLVRSFSPDPDIRANKLQRLSGHLPDPDFALFEFIDHPGGVVIDAGANRGHCALAVLDQTVNLEVIAFEPIAALEKPLQWIERQFPGRFKYHRCALGLGSERAELIVPTAGKLRATTNASIRPSEFSKDYVQVRLADEMRTDFEAIEFLAETVEVRTLDSFELEPLAVKIDVEGMEKEVIEGGHMTITRCKPMLMIEMNNHAEFFPILQSMGYRFYRYEPETKRVLQISEAEVLLNVVALHPDHPLLPAEMIEDSPS